MNDRDHRTIATIWKLFASNFAMRLAEISGGSLFDITIATNISAPIGVAVGGYFSFGW